jgi:hypothetical protein
LDELGHIQPAITLLDPTHVAMRPVEPACEFALRDTRIPANLPASSTNFVSSIRPILRHGT